MCIDHNSSQRSAPSLSLPPPLLHRYQLAFLDVWILCQSAHKRSEEGLICAAKSNLYLFVHAYLHAAGIEYTKAPYPPLRVSADLHATLARMFGGFPFASPAGTSPGAFAGR
ncbi:hypothetical protein T492DRAFT_833786 [Pavlovales sp. CCMP2436]|nr:hypothetical protein T492DRAFT_833786 [Pavlovales sp. CCMP2436]